MRSLLRPVGLLVAILVCLATTGFYAPSARADTPTLTVTLTDVSVNGTSSSSEVTLSGTVTNAGSVPAYSVQVMAWVSREPLQDVATLTSASTGEQIPDGSRLSQEGNFTNLVQNTTPFPAGATKAFTVSATLAQLNLPALNAPYVLGVDVRGNSDATAHYQTLTKARTVVPFAAATSAATTAPLVVLTSQPSLIAAKVFANDHLATELAGGGRLEELLGAVETKHLSYVIDTSLLAEVQRMADGYTLASSNNTTVDGTGNTVAAAWLERFNRLPSANGYRTLFAQPDVTTAARLGNASVLSNAIAADKDLAEPTSKLPLIVLPTDLAGDATTVAYVKDSGATAIATRLLTTDATWVKSTIPLLRVSTPPASKGITAPLGASLYLASEALLLSATHQTQIRVLTTMDDVRALDETPTWLVAEPLSDVLDHQPSTTAATYATASGRLPGLADSEFAKLDELSASMAVFAQLSPTAPTAVASTQIVARAASATWVGHEDKRAVWVSAASHESSEGLRDGKVVLAASDKFLMSGRVNEFPITVTNNFTRPVVVQIKLTSSNPQRLRVSDPDAITVDPGESRTVNIRPEATSNGIATVTAQLVTVEGVPVGTPIDVDVEATQYGMWGWVLVVVSGLVLVGTTAWSVKKTRGRTRAEEAA